MKKIKNLALLMAIVLGLTFTSCTKDNTATIEEETAVAPVGIPQDVFEKAQSLHFNTFDMQKTMFEKPGGKMEEAYLLEGDIMIPHDQLMAMEFGDGITSKQYRTSNLVNDGVITIIGYTGNNSNGLTTKMINGLSWAVDNYNALNLDITFQLTYGTDYENKDMVVYQVSGGAGGSAGFPSGGNPNKWVRINSGLAPYSTNVHEHVIGHEMGHSIGFRHSDYFSRQSCGQNTNEGSAGVGAIHIPGTPTGWDPTSLMNACFSSSEDGEFNSNDITALRWMY
ncbi:dual-action HEIGH metallo-peptidase [Kordia periserrulae]|uniref:Dual-action HEIGH metallo-peptidase n=1 Tax=Kordia periserrulae TaxID=701523 RepID=A0A2T6BTS1_9FLAO|nr:M57 family metalloprotease [Kordia periserrulae]PTX59439.1 dual-action HEIGH metallo-peptidase [Kordia periserrulae]